MKLRNIISTAVFAAVLGLSGVAHAADAYLDQARNLRAGPAKNYPIIAQLPGGTGVNVRGCTEGWKWCDVSYRGAQGWVIGSALQGRVGRTKYVYRGNGQRFGVPVVIFDQRSYWDEHYKDRPWYADKQYWHGQPPVVVGYPPAQVDHDHDGVPDYRDHYDDRNDHHHDYRYHYNN